AMRPLTQISDFPTAAKQYGGQFIEGLSVYVTLELYDGVQRHPVLAPTPSVEFRRIRSPQTNIGITPHHAQQKPYLLLTFIVTARISTYEVVRYVVAQPVPRPTQYTNMLGEQAYFFMQFPVHCLHRTFAILDPTLRELPGMLAYAFTPENLIPMIY